MRKVALALAVLLGLGAQVWAAPPTFKQAQEGADVEVVKAGKGTLTLRLHHKTLALDFNPVFAHDCACYGPMGGKAKLRRIYNLKAGSVVRIYADFNGKVTAVIFPIKK
jgi:hypothetical protein